MENAKYSLLPILVLLFSTSLLAGCLGSSSSSNSEVVNRGLSGQLLPGRYVGEITFSDGTESSSTFLLSSAGQVAQISSDGAANFGFISVDNDGGISGELTNLFFDNGWQNVRASIDGETFNTRSFQGNGILDGEIASDFSFVRVDALADMSASLDDVAGMYFGSPLGGGIDGGNITLNILDDGTLEGSDDTGCVISGEVSVPNEQFNVYELEFLVENCNAANDATAEQRNGNYVGLADLDKDEGEFEALFGNDVVSGSFVGQ